MPLIAILFDSAGVKVGKIIVPFVNNANDLVSGGNFSYSIRIAPDEKAKKLGHKYQLLQLNCKTFVCDKEIYFMACWWKRKELIKHLKGVKDNPISFIRY